MSKTLKMTVSFPVSIVVRSDTMAEFVSDRAKARAMPAEKVATLKGEAKVSYDLLTSERTDEELLELIYRKGARQIIREDFSKELGGNESTVRTGDVKVVFEAPMVPRSCDRCIVTDCQRPLSRSLNTGCPEKQVGLREACGDQPATNKCPVRDCQSETDGSRCGGCEAALSDV